MNHAYTDPVAKLLTYGDVGRLSLAEPWSDCGELGFTAEHIAELIRMATDPDLNLGVRLVMYCVFSKRCFVSPAGGFGKRGTSGAA